MRRLNFKRARKFALVKANLLILLKGKEWLWRVYCWIFWLKFTYDCPVCAYLHINCVTCPLDAHLGAKRSMCSKYCMGIETKQNLRDIKNALKNWKDD